MRRVYEDSINPAPWKLPRLERQYARVDRDEQVAAFTEYIEIGDTILDVGVGGGIEVKLMRKLGINNVIDICDYSQKSIDFVNSKPLDINNAFVCDIEKGLDKDNNSYDIVMGLEIIEHLEDPKVAIAEMIRMARKKVIITCPYKNTFRHRQHHWSIDENDIKSFSNKPCNIKIVDIIKSQSIVAVYHI